MTWSCPGLQHGEPRPSEKVLRSGLSISKWAGFRMARFSKGNVEQQAGSGVC